MYFLLLQLREYDVLGEGLRSASTSLTTLLQEPDNPWLLINEIGLGAEIEEKIKELVCNHILHPTLKSSPKWHPSVSWCDLV